jgi:hypothetical protein
MKVFLEDSLDATLVNCDFEGEASRYVDVWREAGALDASIDWRAVAVRDTGRSHWIPECDLFHMTPFANNLPG